MSFLLKFFRQLWARQNSFYWADIQRQGSILARIVILSVCGADTIAIDLSLSTPISWFMKSIIGFLNNSNLHAIISTLLIINLKWVKKIYFAVLEEIYNNVVPHWSAVLISCNHSITHLISFFQKTVQIRDQFFLYLYMYPVRDV